MPQKGRTLKKKKSARVKSDQDKGLLIRAARLVGSTLGTISAVVIPNVGEEKPARVVRRAATKRAKKSVGKPVPTGRKRKARSITKRRKSRAGARRGLRTA